MKKIYTSAFAFALFSTGIFAQSSNIHEEITAKKAPNAQVENTTPAKEFNDYQKDLQVELWSDDFSDASTWVLDHAATAADFDWEIGIGITNQGSYPSGPLQSTTADNGYAMLDSDYYGSSAGGAEEDCWLTTADSIDLSADPYVVLEFESYYRAFNTDAIFVVISTNNTDWPDLDHEFDASTNDNVFQINPELESNDQSLNPDLIRLNISAIAGGQEKVWIRFNWTGIYGYTWFVDDVKIVELPDNDMRLDYAVISHTGTGEEYGRVPSAQLNASMYLSALSTNAGGETQTDVVTDILILNQDDDEIVNLSSPAQDSIIPTGEYYYEVDDASTFDEGVYTATFTVTSAEEMDGDEFDNNVEVRNFEISDDVYSLDGIGVYEESILSSLGTGSWGEESADGFQMMVWYELVDNTDVHGVEFLITSTTVPGGSVIVHLLDTADVFFGDYGEVDNPIVSSDEVTVTQDHVDAGVIRIYFDSPENLDANAYYASVEMYSEENDFNIRILDDVTVPQPSMASAIWYPGGATPQIYNNGNAAAVRILTMPANSVVEIEDVAVLSQNHPNPAKDFTTISFELLDNQEVTVRLTDMLGKVVAEKNLGNLNPGAHNHTFDLNGLKAGTYHYSIVTENGSLSKSMQIIK